MEGNNERRRILINIRIKIHECFGREPPCSPSSFHSFIVSFFIIFRELSVSSQLRSGVTISCCDRRPLQALLSSPLQQVSTGLLDKTWTFSRKVQATNESLLNLLIRLRTPSVKTVRVSSKVRSVPTPNCAKASRFTNTTHPNSVLCDVCVILLSWKLELRWYISKISIYRNVEIYQIDVTLVIWSEKRDTRLY